MTPTNPTTSPMDDLAGELEAAKCCAVIRSSNGESRDYRITGDLRDRILTALRSPIAGREEEVERALKSISADLWNAIGNETNAVATKFGIDGWYRLVCEVIQPHRAALASIPPGSDPTPETK